MNRRTGSGWSQLGLALACLVALSADEVSAQSRGTVTGTVTDREGTPLRDITIRFVMQPADRDVVQTAKTNKKGVFFTRGLATGEYRVELDDASLFVLSADLEARSADGVTMGSGRVDGHPVRGLNPIPFSEAFETRMDLVVAERGSAEARERLLAFALPALSAAADLYRKGEAEQVVRETDKILAENPGLGEALYLRGLGLEKLGRYPEAVAALEAAVAAIPDYGGIEGVLGEFRMSLGEELTKAGNDEAAAQAFAGSAQAYREALRRDPDSAVYLANLAAALDRTGDDEALLPVLEQLLARDPQDLPTRLRLAGLQSERGNTERAMELLRAVPDTEKRAAVTLYNLAVRMNESGDIDGSLLAATRAAEIDPQLPHPYRLIAQIQLGRGDMQAASAAIRRFLELAPDDPEADVYRSILEDLAEQKP